MVKEIKKLQMGKYGLTDEFVNQVKSLFTKEKMLKISILKSACRNKSDLKKVADELMIRLGSNYDYKAVGYVLTVMKFRKKVR